MRKFERLEASGEVVCRTPSTIATGQLQDISPKGCKVEGDSSRIARGTTVLVELLNGVSIPGEVRWAKDAVWGIEFNVRLLDSIVQHLRVDGTGRGRKADVTKGILRDRFGRPLPTLSEFKPIKR